VNCPTATAAACWAICPLWHQAGGTLRRFDVGNDLNRTSFTLAAEAEAKRPDDRLIETLLWKIGYRNEVANSIN
jgi:hypothetical protein